MQIKDSFHQRMLTKKKTKWEVKEKFYFTKETTLIFYQGSSRRCRNFIMRLDMHGDSLYFYDFRFDFSLSLSSFVLKQTFVFRDLSAGHPEKDAFVLAV